MKKIILFVILALITMFLAEVKAEEVISKEEAEIIINKKERSAVLAGLSSLLVSGMGQCLINEDPQKGTLFFVGTYGLFALGIHLHNAYGTGFIGISVEGAVCQCVAVGIFIWNIIDAPVIAYKYNKKLRSAKSKIKVGLSPSIVPIGMNSKDLGYGITLKVNF
jgi:hypothetical protein